MSVFKESPRTHLHVRTPIMIGIILALVIVLSALAYYRRYSVPSPVELQPPAATTPTAPSSPAPAREEPRPSATAPAPAPPSSSKTTKPAPTAAPTEAPPAPTRATVTIQSDVPGASVFVDRQFVGTAPVTVENLVPGSKQINLSADGFDGISRTTEITAGAQTVSMRFKEIRLDKRIPVTHKHGMGSCSGELVATIDGLRYVTSNAKDAGTVPFAALEQFEVNYLEKTLRVKQRGGRTWNFTDGNPNADVLFVFHRDVESARKKLADGYSAVR